MPEQQPRRCYHRFSAAEQRFICRHYATMTVPQLAQALQLPQGKIHDFIKYAREGGEPWARKSAAQKRPALSRAGQKGMAARYGYEIDEE